MYGAYGHPYYTELIQDEGALGCASTPSGGYVGIPNIFLAKDLSALVMCTGGVIEGVTGDGGILGSVGRVFTTGQTRHPGGELEAGVDDVVVTMDMVRSVSEEVAEM